MQAAPAITAAFACAPDIPPKPDVTKHMPPRLLSDESPNFRRAAFIKVIVVPCTIPCGPIYMYEPAVI